MEIKELVRLRNEINDLDQEIIKLLSNRMDLVKSVSDLKAQSGMSVVQHGFWNKKLKGIITCADGSLLSKDFVTSLFELIHQESVNYQNRQRS